MLDCNAGLHILPGHPLEVNVNLRGALFAMNVLAQEITARAQCAAFGVPSNPDVSSSTCAADLTEEVINRHFIPSVPMLLNNLEPLRSRRRLPRQCQQHRPGQTVPDGKPVFAQTFFDDSAISTVFAQLLNMPSLKIPQFWIAPSSCTYDRYVNGDGGCAVTIREPMTGANFNLGAHVCPLSYLPYVSLTCTGAICNTFMRPCASSFETGLGPDECNYAQTGLVCRALSNGVDWASNNLAMFENFLNMIGLGNKAAEFAKCDKDNMGNANLGETAKLNQLRQKMYSFFNLTWPASASASTALSFCMVPAGRWEQTKAYTNFASSASRPPRPPPPPPSNHRRKTSSPPPPPRRSGRTGSRRT